jgi:hypothetical protein
LKIFYNKEINVNKCSVKNTIFIFMLFLVLLLLAGTIVMVGKGQQRTQMTLPFALPQSKPIQVMPPDPDEWCRRADLKKLDYEVEKVEAYFETGYGRNLIDWKYLRRALGYTGVTVRGAEDEYWLRTIKGLYQGCKR